MVVNGILFGVMTLIEHAWDDMGRLLWLQAPAHTSYLSFQPVIHDWCNTGRGMCYSLCGMVHIKEPLLLIEKSSPCGGSGFPLSLSE